MDIITYRAQTYVENHSSLDQNNPHISYSPKIFCERKNAYTNTQFYTKAFHYTQIYAASYKTQN